MTGSSSREEAFTTIRITKRDRDLLGDLALPRENLWETFRRVTEAAAVSLIKKKEAHMRKLAEFQANLEKEDEMRRKKPTVRARKQPRKSLSDKYKRIIRQIENGFIAYRKRGVEQVSFTQLKDWMNENTKDGISSPRLANFLRRRPQFHLVRKERRHGSNRVQVYWALHYGNFDEVSKGETPPGWVDVPFLADTGISANE